MREELRRSNTIGDSQGILCFAEIILKFDEIKRESARQICSFVNDSRIDFNNALYFFEYLGFISVSTNSITPTENGIKLYAALNNTGFEEALCEACLAKVTNEGIIDIGALHFDPEKGKYYILKHGFPIHAAVFRNILIQFCALVERTDGSLEIHGHYEGLFAKAQKTSNRKMTLESLKKRLEQQEKQGEDAELFVLQYEVFRINSSPLSERIKRISDIDVSAGYDIVSFENKESSNYDRYIEVKSFVGQPHFYWSKNEIEIATVRGDSYYIYLVNAKKSGQHGYCPTIIRNPVKVMMTSEYWLMQPISYLVLSTGECLNTDQLQNTIG